MSLIKWEICYWIGEIEFVRLILREGLLCLFFIRPYDSCISNIKWLVFGGTEFEQNMKHFKDIPCEVAAYYIGFVHKCIYE